ARSRQAPCDSACSMGAQSRRRASSMRSISFSIVGLGDRGIIRNGAQNTIVSPNMLGRRSDKVTWAHIGKEVHILDVRERNAFFSTAAAHEERITEVEHFVD